MNDHYGHTHDVHEPGRSWGLEFVGAVVIIGLLLMALGGAISDDGSRQPSTYNRTTRTDVQILSGNDVRLFSPTINTYVNTGDTTATQSTTVEGDRNNVQQTLPDCWISSKQDWGPCPPNVQAGSAVP